MKRWLGRAWPLLALAVGCSPPLERVFSTSGDAPSRSGLAALGDGAVFGNEAGRVVRLGPSGAPLWSAELAREVRLTPLVVGDTVVVATLGSQVLGLDAATGAQRWRSALARNAAALASVGKRVAVLCEDGELSSFDAATGALVTRSNWGTALGLRPTVSARLNLTAGPGERLLLSGPTALVALGPDGARLWRTAIREASGLLVEDGLVWAVEQNGRVVALDVEAGELQWQRMLEAPPTSPPARALDRLWVGLQNQTLVGFRPKDAGPVWTVPVPGPVVAAVVELDGRLLVPTSAREGRLLALEVGAPGNPPSARLDSPLRTSPLVRGDAVWVIAQDGRVLGFRLRSAAGNGR